MNATEAMQAGAGSSAKIEARAVPLPLAKRKLDMVIIGFYLINLLVITYVVDIEQLTIPDVSGAWTYPVWPPKAAVDVIHWYGTNFDPVLMARPMWWKMTIWWDVLGFGPYYVFAIYAFWKGKDWIRLPSILQSSFLIVIVTIIMGEEIAGAHATPRLGLVAMLNAPWLLLPMVVIARLYKSDKPFAR